MNVENRIKTSLLLMEIKEKKEVARRLGLVDVSRIKKECKKNKKRR